MDTGN
jgi:predicted heme/steroid binding protein